MAEQQAGSPPPESYDAGMLADVRAAFEEVSKPEAVKETPEPAAEKVAEAKPAEAKPTEAKTDQPASDRERNPDGTFKAKAEDQPAKVAPEAKAAEQQPPPPKEPPPPVAAAAAPVPGAPPPGWSIKSKSEWDKLPEHIRADIIKREQEVASGFAEYSGMKELKPYIDKARAEGQTLKTALDNYVGMENLLRQNPLQGLLHIARNFGYAPERLAMELAPLLGSSTAQQGNPQAFQQPALDPNLMQMLNPLLSPLQQEISGLRSLFQQQTQAAQTRELSAVNSALERFKADPAHRYFDNLEPQIIKLFEGGLVPRSGDHGADLKAAYELACRMHPEISETLLNERLAKTEADRKAQEKEAAEKAKQASRSITGSPSAGSKDESSPDESIEETVRKAYRAHAA